VLHFFFLVLLLSVFETQLKFGLYVFYHATHHWISQNFAKLYRVFFFWGLGTLFSSTNI